MLSYFESSAESAVNSFQVENVSSLHESVTRGCAKIRALQSLLLDISFAIHA
jgi:hypothetical protein